MPEEGGGEWCCRVEFLVGVWGGWGIWVLGGLEGGVFGGGREGLETRGQIRG